MAGRHADAQFSEAYDGALGAAARSRFDSHLAACPRCAAAFADYACAVDAVRTLPQVPMPVPVRLPAGAPGPAGAAELGGGAAWLRAALARVRLTPGLGALAATAVAVVAVVGVSVGLGQRSSTGPTTAARSTAAEGAAPRALAETPAQGRALPGFPNAATLSVPGRPGATLVLATPAGRYAPGAAVTIYARLVDPRSGSSLPEVRASVEPPAVAAPAAGPGAVPPAATSVAPVVTTLAPTRLSAPQGAAAGHAADSLYGPYGDGLPLLQILIPSGLPSGARVELVATAAQGGSGAPVSVVLTLTVG